MIEIALRKELRAPSPAPGSADDEVTAPRSAGVTVTSPPSGGPPSVARDLMSELADGPLPWPRLAERGAEQSKSADRERREAALMVLVQRRLIEFRCVVDGRQLALAFPASTLCAPGFDRAVSDDTVLRLSRFACVRRVDDELTIESPVSGARIHARDPIVGRLVAVLAQSRSVTELHKEEECPEDILHEIVRFMLAFEVIGMVDDAGRLLEDCDDQLIQREFHDVLFHSASRRGLTDQPMGASFPFIGQIDPSPAIKPAGNYAVTSLPRPDIAHIADHDPPFGRVMESRRSTRRHGSTPINITQLSEFLYRIARIRRLTDIDPEAGRYYETTNRTYPSGGASYDLELYVTVRCCQGITPAVYHYEPADHALSLISAKPDDVITIINDAYNASGRVGIPHVVITMSSRFNRLAWKYRGLSYATTLKNVGVMYEAMYLTAACMGLAACGLGAGSAAFFSSVTGLDPLVESSVGEFMLGTLPVG
jgi:oxazoline/thiazoline dehydrogenase